MTVPAAVGRRVSAARRAAHSLHVNANAHHLTVTAHMSLPHGLLYSGILKRY